MRAQSDLQALALAFWLRAIWYSSGGLPRSGESIAQSQYHSWSKGFLNACKKHVAGDTARAATPTEVKDLRREARDFKEVVAEQTLQLLRRA